MTLSPPFCLIALLYYFRALLAVLRFGWFPLAIYCKSRQRNFTKRCSGGTLPDEHMIRDGMLSNDLSMFKVWNITPTWMCRRPTSFNTVEAPVRICKAFCQCFLTKFDEKFITDERFLCVSSETFVLINDSIISISIRDNYPWLNWSQRLALDRF